MTSVVVVLRELRECVMAYAATAGGSLPSMTAAPGVLALQRALVWLVGASGAIVFIEPSPYETGDACRRR